MHSPKVNSVNLMPTTSAAPTPPSEGGVTAHSLSSEDKGNILLAPPSEDGATASPSAILDQAPGRVLAWQSSSERPLEFQGPCTAPVPRIVLPNPVLAGRLRFFTKNWQHITQDPWVLGIVSGLKLSFTHTPFQSKPPVLRVAQEEHRCISEEVQTLLEKGAIRLVPKGMEGQCFLSSVFTVPKKDGGRRPIINLKSLNKFIPHHHFKMEGIHSLRDIVLQGDFMIKLDLKDAFFSVPVHHSFQKYLGFKWEDREYLFQCMPFGLTSAPRIFTKLMRPVVTILRL